MGRSDVGAFISDHSAALPRQADEIVQDFDALQRLLEKWQRIQNLVSRETPGDYWSRHVYDSLGLLPLLNDALAITDLGSGGGFPALPLAVALKGSKVEFTLVEANSRKCAFLNAARRELGLAIRVSNARIEAVDVSQMPVPNVITARALAPLPILMSYARRFVRPQTRLLLHKGRDYGEELAQLDSVLQASVLIHSEHGRNGGVILEWPAGSML